jgi:hypothetical protein
MARFIGRNWVRLLLTSYLVLAVMGAFTFSDKAFPFDKSDRGTSVFFTPILLSMDCLAEDTITIGRINRTGDSVRTSGSMPDGIYTETYLAGSSLQAANNYHIPVLKNTIQLNLRI